MSTKLAQFRLNLKEPWLQALILIAIIPLFPEYISFLLVIPAVFLAWMDIRRRKERIKIGFIGKLLLVYIGYMLITVTYSNNKLYSLAIVGMWAFFYLVYLLVNNLLADTERCDSFLLCITAVAGAVGLIACCQYRIGYFTDSNLIQFWGWLDSIVFDWLPLRLQNPTYVLRSGSTFNNPNILAEYLMTIAPFVVYFNFCERRKDIRLFCRICLLLTLCGVLFSFSRGGYLALIVLCVALIVLNIRHRFAAVTMYLVSAFILVPDEIVKRLLSIIPGLEVGGKFLNSVTSTTPSGNNGGAGGSANGSVGGSGIDSTPPPTVTTPAEIINNSTADLAINERLRIWLECLKHIGERPFFGYGAGTQNTWDMLEESGIYSVHAHNLVLQLLLEGGIVALAIMSVIGFTVIRYAVQLMRAGRTRAFWMGFAVLMFAASFVLHGLVDYPLLSPKLVCNFIMILAIIERALPLYVDKGIPLKIAYPRKAKKAE